MFACFLIFEFRKLGLFFGIIWIILLALDQMILGYSALNHVIFGISIGIWISCTILYLLDYDMQVTRHFQKLIRGRYLSDQSANNQLVIFITFCMIIIYTIAYLTTDSILKNNVADLMTDINSYFSVI